MLINNINDTVKVKDIATNTVGELNDLRYEYNKKRVSKEPLKFFLSPKVRTGTTFPIIQAQTKICYLFLYCI